MNGVRIRLHCNEAALPPPEHVIEAVRALNAQAYRAYPGDAQQALAAELAESLQRKADEIVVANGADELLRGIARAFLSPGDEAIFADPSFGMYEQAVLLAHGMPRPVSYRKRWKLDLRELLGTATERTRLILLGNPNNPTADPFSPDDLRLVAQSIPRAIVVVDEVYLSPSAPSLLAAASALPNVIAVRSLSKVAALAGMRVGYALATRKNADAVRGAIGPYPLSVASIAAARAYVTNAARAREFEICLGAQVARSLDAFESAIGPFANAVWRGSANFLLIDMGSRAASLVQRLARDGIAVRTFENPLLDGMIRINAASDDDTDVFLRSFRSAMIDAQLRH